MQNRRRFESKQKSVAAKSKKKKKSFEKKSLEFPYLKQFTPFWVSK